jgi:hypothetical protein
MSGRGPPPSVGRRQRSFVDRWEDLPEGEWLENDENGNHWYLDVEGNYWQSTDDGYRIWVDEEEVTSSSTTESTYQYETDEDEGGEDDVEEEEEPGPSPRLGAGTALLGIGLALIVIAWTYFITMPTAELNIELQSSEATQWGGEMSKVFLDGLELYQLLNTVTLVISAVMIGLAVMTITKKTPWWTVSASNFALLCVLFIASLVAFSSEQKSVDACDPLVYYCYGFEQPSILLIDAFYPALFSMAAFFYIFNTSLKTWADFDPNQEPEPELDIQIFSRDAPKLGAFPALIGLVTGLAVLAFTQIVSVAEAVENIDIANDLGMVDMAEMFETVLFYNQLAVGLSGFVVLVSLLSLIQKVPWWTLPASCFLLIPCLFIIVNKSDYNGLTTFEQDAFFTGVGSLFATMIIGVSAFHTLANHEWEELDGDDGYSDIGGTNSFDLYDDEEELQEWRGKVRTAAMVLLVLVAGIGGFFLQQYVTSAANEPTFSIRDANGVLSDGSYDELVVLDLMDKTGKFSEETIEVKIESDGNELGEVVCRWKQSGKCTFEYLEIFDDRRLTAMESILISEGGSVDWCSGAADETCKITVGVYHSRSTENEDMQVSVEVIELGSYTITVV